MPKILAEATRPNATKNGFNAAIALFNRRWTMKILWELRSRPMTFRLIQAACSDVSSSVLNVRLSELREAQLIEHTQGEGYALTGWGQELLTAMKPVAVWAARWHRAIQE